MIKVVTITNEAWDKGPKDFEGVYESSYLIKLLEEGWVITNFRMVPGKYNQVTWTFILEKINQ